MIPEVVELEKELLFLYQLYTRLEKRLMELLEKEKQEIAQELRQIELQRFLKL
ncbi:MAG: hypothetical protein NZM25_08610 [Leptospiraceae bacterium]|nr:hypothetical protein [Leptospiraceae bacterium]MDW8306778.1 hypothetical protein [Leptospiraceae bacterium]